ncbi:MAG: DUF4298 domain-containing protein [Bacilli bacterium]|nr:DUF4298 domain-containing protein [Bacilli bacterium]
MINRISKNEEKLDKALSSVKNLEEALYDFKSNKKNIEQLNKYYGSKEWFKDKDAYEQNKIPKVKAGVLSEDAVWNLNEDVKDLINEMRKIVGKWNNEN